ncbi:MAG: putative Ig domain-containing protein [Synergistaceae bacterium]|nr:putative Ig domain-containing protein [Synergistaceae bacterium]
MKCNKYLSVLAAVIMLVCAGTGHAKEYTSTTPNTHALSLSGESEEFSDAIITKTGDASGQNSNYDELGTNAAVYADEGAELTIEGASEIRSSAAYGHAVFSYGGELDGENSGDDTKITLSNTAINTQSNNSSGLMATGGGIIEADSILLDTTGASSPAIYSGKGGGTITVKDSTISTAASNTVIIEGGGTVEVNNVNISAFTGKSNGTDTNRQAVLIRGDNSDAVNTFSMTGGSLTFSKGTVFQVSRAAAEINISNGVYIKPNGADDYFMKAESGKVTLNVTDNSAIYRNILVDSSSSLELNLSNEAAFYGTINPSGASGTVDVSLAPYSKWELSGNSYVSSLNVEETCIVVTMGYKLYVDGVEYVEPPMIDKEALLEENEHAVVNKSFNHKFKVHANNPVTWSVTEGTLPVGLTLNSSTGKLTGKATTAGDYTFTLTATNSGGSASTEITLNVVDVAPKIKATIRAGTVDVPYSTVFSLSAGTGTVDWECEEDKLPDGLVFEDMEDGTAKISGTPTEGGTFKFDVSAHNTGGDATKTCTLKISVTRPTITAKSLNSGMAGEIYEMPIELTGSKVNTVKVDGLPKGLSYEVDEGVLTITGAPEESGKFNVKIQAENAGGKLSKTLKLVIDSEPVINDVTLEDGTTGKSYSKKFTATGTTPITWSVEDTDTLPEGLTINAKSGQLKGKPTGSGSYTFIVKAENKYGEDTKEVTVKINAVAPQIKTKNLKAGTAGKAYNVTLKASGTQPITWTLDGELPDGITFEDGVFSGTSEAAFSGTVRVHAQNAGGDANTSYKLEINALKPTITTKSLPDGNQWQDYSATLSATGTGEITWKCDRSTMPAGLELDAETGKISGTPLSSGTYRVKVTATNEVKSVSKTLKLKIEASPVAAVAGGFFETGNNSALIEPVSGLSLPEGYEIVFELGEIKVDESGMYDMRIELEGNAKPGRKLFWLARAQDRDPSEDDAIAEFFDAGGEEINEVPRNRKIIASAWLEGGVTYKPVIAAK